ncbi:hypothetical protein PV371_24190 [Streptomyces sp. TX20-6-3]|uniref:hypothetical protein n=1 Tax=Streptomyces sp. TX20-6-3 TaxID=3028705 RepID=UPI0029B25037|nr:hypothetical protein [Streptomyces sp. TX20-6-3]MDX2562734.1 hypothetical protein [Streptomyces sp. TX20-6-3]
MPQNEGPQHEGFEDELGAMLRRTGDGFAADDRRELVEGGLRRGKRRLVRRRLAMTGGVLALAAIGIGGAYGGSLLSPAASSSTSSVAAPPTSRAGVDPVPGKQLPGEAKIPVKDIAAALKNNTPAGTWQFDNLDGTGQSVAGVFDDGNGKAGVTVGLFRTGTGEAGEDQVACPDKVAVPYDDCTEETLTGGSRLMILQGYEYPDKREETKAWRAVLLTRDGFLIDVSEYNAAAEKGAPVSRENPPFTPAQLKALVTAPDWGPLAGQLPENLDVSGGEGGQGGGAGQGGGGDEPPRHVEPDGAAVQSTLRSLLPKGLKVADKGGDGEYAYVVVDDGKGKSLVQINVQPNMSNVAGDLFGSGDVTTLPDGRRVKLTQQPGEKGGEGVVWWTVDTITPEGFRVVVSAFNAGTQHEAATRAEPTLTMEQLKSIALSPKWQKLTTK